MSEIKVNKVTPRVACGTTQLGDSGDTITIPSGATITNLGTATGFGGTGVVSWETSSIKTTGFTAVTGTGYFCNTTGGAFTVTLPLSPSAGDVVGVADYAKTFDTANLTLGRNGSNIGGVAVDATISTEGIAVTLVYVDATKGWIVTDSGNQTDAPGPTYIAATGGCIATCGNYKTHTFLSPNTFVVCSVGNPAGSTTVDYLVVAGGGGGGGNGGGGGAGGFRFYMGPACAPGAPALPINGPAAITVTATPYAITVGGGAAGQPGTGCQGNNSVFSTITSAGGGGGGSGPSAPTNGPCATNTAGGSGGGAGRDAGPLCSGKYGRGDTPPTSPAQGTDGGRSGNTGWSGGGGGGGAIVIGGNAPGGGTEPTETAGNGGAGGGLPAGFGANGIPCGSYRYYAGGGGGGQLRGSPTPACAHGAPGLGGGGIGATDPSVSPEPGRSATVGAINTGGGGGGTQTGLSANGGSGIVVIRYRYQ